MDQQEEFKIPIDQFTKQLDALEQSKHSNGLTSNISRISLFRQFDPLINVNSSTQSSKPIVIEEETANFSLQSNDNEQSHNESIQNRSSILLQINESDNQKTNENFGFNDNNTNGYKNIDDIMNVTPNGPIEDEKIGEFENNIGDMALINQHLINNIQQLKQQLVNCQNEIDRLNSIKSHLEDELNNIEKHYYDTHSRYESLRTIVKDMDARQAKEKELHLELSEKLNEKEQECQQLKQSLDQTIENVNRRLQNVNQKETMALKAQIKVLEMRVNSLQSQVEQKNKENEELTHIVDELIGKKN